MSGPSFVPSRHERYGMYGFWLVCGLIAGGALVYGVVAVRLSALGTANESLAAIAGNYALELASRSAAPPNLAAASSAALGKEEVDTAFASSEKSLKAFPAMLRNDEGKNPPGASSARVNAVEKPRNSATVAHDPAAHAPAVAVPEKGPPAQGLTPPTPLPASPAKAPASTGGAALVPPPTLAVTSTTFEQSGISGLDPFSVQFTSGRRVSVGGVFPSGERLLSVFPNEGKIVTDQRVINLKIEAGAPAR
ncbi:MAG: hypothetical protein V4731_04885 [Pseudomonadota bacterium]